MTSDARIKKISEASGLSVDEVKGLIEKKKEETAGLLTDHGAIYALEKEYGISHEEGGRMDFTKISDIKPNENNINIVGVVKEVRPIKKFQTDKRSGQLARVVLADDKGETNVILWDKLAELVNTSKLSLGKIVIIKNGYTREGLDKKPEVHVGNLGRIIIEPKNIDPELTKQFPKIEEKLTKIGELKENEVASTQGRVLYIYDKSEFDRPDGRKGQRASMIIEDETGKLRVVLWDSNADLISRFSEGDVVKIENGQVRQGNRGLEIHIGNRGRVLPSDAKLDLPEMEEAKIYKLAEMEEGLQNVNVAGRVMRILPIKEFTSGNRTGKLASLILIDETGILRAVLWNEKADHVKKIKQGDTVLIRSGYTKPSLTGEMEVHVPSRGSIHINPENVKVADITTLINKHAEEKKISDIKPDDRNVRIIGTIEDVDESPIMFEICRECGSRIENVAGEWLCDICGEAEPAYGMVISCGVSDGSGDIRAVFYRDLAEQLTGLSVTDALNLIGETGDELAPVRQVRDGIVGKSIAITGNARYNDYQDKLELVVSSLEMLPSTSKTPKKSVSKKGTPPDDVPEEVLRDADLPEGDIEVEEIKLDE